MRPLRRLFTTVLTLIFAFETFASVQYAQVRKPVSRKDQARIEQMQQVAKQFATNHPGAEAPYVFSANTQFTPYAYAFMGGLDNPFIRKGAPVDIDLHLLGASYRGRVSVDCYLWLPDQNGNIVSVEVLPLTPDFSQGFDGGSYLNAASFTIPKTSRARGEVQVTLSLRAWGSDRVLANAFTILYLGDTAQQEIDYYYMGSVAPDDSGNYVARGWFPQGFALYGAWEVGGKLYPVTPWMVSYDGSTIRGIPAPPQFAPVDGVAGPARLLFRSTTNHWGWAGSGYAGVAGDRTR